MCSASLSYESLSGRVLLSSLSALQSFSASRIEASLRSFSGRKLAARRQRNGLVTSSSQCWCFFSVMGRSVVFHGYESLVSE